MFKRFILTILFSSALFATNPWLKTTPQNIEYDWLQFTSGEWIKGELKSFYEESVEFDSDQFDLVSIKIEDIKRIYTVKSMDIFLEDTHKIKLGESIFFRHKNIIQARIVIENNKIFAVYEDNTSIEIPRYSIVSVTTSSKKERDYWSASFQLGLNYSSGNTNQVNLITKANAKRRTADTKFIIDYLAEFTQSDGNVTTAENHRANTSLDVYQTRHLYLRAFTGGYFRDPFQNIEDRYTVGMGIGYNILDTPLSDLAITIGPGYQETRYVSVDTTHDKKATTAVGILNINLDSELSKDVDLIVKYESFFINEKAGDYTHHFITTIETEFITDFIFDVSGVWDRVNSPIKREDLSVPDKNDYKLLFTVGYSY